MNNASAATTPVRQSLGQTSWGAVTAVGRGLRRQIWLATRTGAGRIGLPIVAFYLFLAIMGPVIAPYPATQFHLQDQLSAPSWTYWLGTDEYGRDILSRVLSGARSIIVIATLGAALGITLGTLVGMTSAYKGGRTDEFTMRVMDGLMSFPALLMALLVLTTLGANAQNIILTIGVVFMPRVARILRSATLSIKTLEFVQNARLRGESSAYIIFREILPNTIPVLTVEASVRLSFAILLASSLGFLGLGVQPPSPDWGLMISESRRFITTAPWVALAPAGAVASLVIGVNLLAEGMRQAQHLPRVEEEIE
ncbi:MAG: ABC transporter permease [Chloroflexi bacterium]|nr:ABC transporter permease [Chloroflexota bacterium]